MLVWVSGIFLVHTLVVSLCVLFIINLLVSLVAREVLLISISACFAHLLLIGYISLSIGGLFAAELVSGDTVVIAVAVIHEEVI